jgi:hypothetical protein
MHYFSNLKLTPNKRIYLERRDSFWNVGSALGGSLKAGAAIEHHENHKLKSLSNNFRFDVNLINFDRRHTKTNSFSSHRMAKVQIARKIVLFSHFCRPMTCLISNNKSKSQCFFSH